MTEEQTPAEKASYELYEELLLKRDRLEREAASILTAYTLEFGEALTDVFREKIACIRQKKAIAFCLTSLNRGQPVDLQAMERALDRAMADYRHTLKCMMDNSRAAQKAEKSSILDIERAKKLYRKLARMIHPDLHPYTARSPELSGLWNRVVSAYHSSDVGALGELEVLIVRALAAEGIETGPVDIPDIDEKIRALQEEIADILTTEPYTYEALLMDSEAVRQKKEELENELKNLKEYHAELDAQLKKLIAEGGLNFEWKMD